MSPWHDTRHRSGVKALDDDSAVAVLQQLAEERGQLFSEKEYQEMRRSVVEELALGARRRPFTLLTFAVVGMALLGLLTAGLITHAQDQSGELALALVSGLALAVAAYLFWSYLRGIHQD